MSEMVEVSLQAYLTQKHYKVGDSLPTEKELASTLEVSRSVIREALSKFKLLGIIESRKKTGMVISNPDLVGTIGKILHPQILDDATLQDLFELRLVIEGGLADLLYLRKTDKAIAELETIALNEKAGKAFAIENEIAFHGKLYEMTGNQTLKKFQLLLLPVFAYAMSSNKKFKPGRIRHIDLVQILKKGTRNDFKEGMFEHLHPHYERLQK
jgi:GntR family transcriptional repressor for pyruvate dehydrogenase complex